MAYQRKNGKQPGVIIYFDFHESLEILAQQDGAAAVGNVVLALLDYAEHGVIPADGELTPTEQMLFKVMRSRADAAAESYRQTCERNAMNGQKGGLTKAMNATSDPEKKNDYLAALTAPRGVPAIMGGLQERPKTSMYPSWREPLIAIPQQGGGVGALTADNTSHLLGVFPGLDLEDAAHKWAEYLSAVGEKDLPKYATDAFESWCRKLYHNS